MSPIAETVTPAAARSTGTCRNRVRATTTQKIETGTHWVARESQTLSAGELAPPETTSPIRKSRSTAAMSTSSTFVTRSNTGSDARPRGTAAVRSAVIARP